MTAKAALLLGLWLAASALAAAQGGPPLRTDDPGTPGNENWEVNVGVTTELRSTQREFEAPNLDINYGLGDRIQLKYEARLPAERDTSFDIGGRLRLSRMAMLTFMAGRSFRGPSSGRPQFIAYLGMQFLLLDEWEPEDHPRKTRRP
jgi:hypothetical protein